MHLSVELRYPAPVDHLAAALADPDFWRWRTREAGGHVESLDVTALPDTVTVTLRRVLLGPLVPPRVRGAVGGRLEVRQTEAWAPRVDGTVAGTVVLEITGAPVRVNGATTVQPVTDGCVHRYEGEVVATVPLFAAAIEEAAADTIRALLLAEESAVRRWLVTHAG